MIRSDPNLTVIPGFLVTAVAHAPNGCHPSPCPDYYGRDHAFFDAYHESSRTRGGFLEWLESWLARKETL